MAVVLSVPLSISFGTSTWAAQGNEAAHAADRVTICHATGNGNFVALGPSRSGDAEGHAGHEDDVIPAFDYLENGVTQHFAGQNLDGAGQDLVDRGCAPAPLEPPVDPPVVDPDPVIGPVIDPVVDPVIDSVVDPDPVVDPVIDPDPVTNPVTDPDPMTDPRPCDRPGC